MGRGYLFGLLVGILVSALGLSGISLMVPVGGASVTATATDGAGTAASAAGNGAGAETADAGAAPAAQEAASPPVPETIAAAEPATPPAVPEEPAAQATSTQPDATPAPEPAPDSETVPAPEPSSVRSPEPAAAPAPEPAPEPAPAAATEAAPAAAVAGAPDAPLVEVPPGSEFNRPKPETAPVIPAAEPEPATAALPSVAAPEAENAPAVADATPAAMPTAAPAPVAPAAPEAAAAAAPSAPASEAAVPVPPPGEAAAPSLVTEATPEAPAPVATAESAPAAAPATAPAAAAPPEAEPEPAPEAAAAIPAPVPAPDEIAEPDVPSSDLPEDADDAPVPPEEEELAQDGGPIIVGSAPGAPKSGFGQKVQSGFGGAIQPGFGQSTPGVKINRLPSIGGEAATAEPEFVPAPGEVPAVEPAPAGPVADSTLKRFAAAFDNPEHKPLVAVVLVDIGEAKGGVAPDAVPAIGRPVTVAIDPAAADAAARATTYRLGGDEIAILAPGLPEGATPGDLETSYQGIVGTLPEAVAIVGTPDSAFQTDRRIAQHLVSLLATEGRGLVTYTRGLDPAGQAAEREGLPHAAIARDLDAAGENSATIIRSLDRAAFEAERLGRVVVVGTTSPETVAALQEWIAGGARGAIVGPVSAAMLEAEPAPAPAPEPAAEPAPQQEAPRLPGVRRGTVSQSDY